MPYFETFPSISYDPTGNKFYKDIKDILIRVTVRDQIKGSHALFEKYDIKDGETPESLAFEKYDDVNLHWVILLYNDIVDPFYDWPLSMRDFEKFVKEKYTNPDAIHHYEKAQLSGETTVKIKVPSTTALATAVTNYEYEEALNDDKKQIKLLKPSYVGQFILEMADRIRNG